MYAEKSRRAQTREQLLHCLTRILRSEVLVEHDELQPAVDLPQHLLRRSGVARLCLGRQHYGLRLHGL